MRQFRRWMGGKKYVLSRQEATRKLNDSISTVLSRNIGDLHALFSQTPDLITRQFQIKQNGKLAVLVYFEGLVDKSAINRDVLRPLMDIKDISDPAGDLILTVSHLDTVSSWSYIETALLHGNSVLFIDERAEAFIFGTQGWPQRAIEDPQLEASIKGAHQGFVETSSQNIALIRRYLPNRELKIKELVVGRRGKARVSILYLADVAHPEVLQELEERIRKLDVDSILNTGELAEYIEDNPYSPFPQFVSTERPDAAASHILQGRMAILVDRSPSVLIGPATLISFFQSVDDYSTRWLIASFIRLLRFLGFFIAAFLPAVYIALISFNYEIIPLELILSVGASRERVPFPPLVEAMMMEITLEMLREAGIRLPSPIGQTVGIVGGIIIGQTAVQAGIVSNIMVIVVASTAIASFIIPSYDMASAVRLLRFPMMLIASMFGMVGIAIGIMALIGHLIALESLGTPYGSPLAPVRFHDWQDTFVRVPLWKMQKRPQSGHPIQRRRVGGNRPKGDGK